MRTLVGQRVAAGVGAMVVPGSTATRLQAEREGLDRIFTDAGFAWREAGCSMCVAINDDRLPPGGRTHLMSPAMAAAAAIVGHLVDVRDLANA